MQFPIREMEQARARVKAEDHLRVAEPVARSDRGGEGSKIGRVHLRVGIASNVGLLALFTSCMLHSIGWRSITVWAVAT